jgi:hypothetical protein
MRGHAIGMAQAQVRSGDLVGSLLGRLVAVGASTAYLAALEFVYRTHLSPLFSYDGALYEPARDGSLAAALVIATIPSVWLPLRVSRPSQVVEWLLYLVAYVPSIIFPYLILGSGFAGIAPFTVAVAASWALLGIMLRFGPRWTLRPPAISATRYGNGLLTFAVVLAAYIAAALGVSFALPDPGNVYDVRTEYNEAVGGTLPFAAYIVSWSGNVVNPLLLAVGLVWRRPLLVVVAVVLELGIYATSGYKSALFSAMLLVPLLVLLTPALRGQAGRLLPVGAVALVVSAWVVDQVTDSLLATALFVRRLFALPGQVVAHYYEHFSQNPGFGLSHSILSWLRPRPDPLDPPNVIGATYFGDPAITANANFWADGMANFGLPGVVAFTILLGVVLWVLDAVATGRDLRLTGSIAGLMALLLANSGVLTTLASHGLGLAIVLLALLPIAGAGRGTIPAREPSSTG